MTTCTGFEGGARIQYLSDHLAWGDLVERACACALRAASCGSQRPRCLPAHPDTLPAFASDGQSLSPQIVYSPCGW